MKIASYVVRGRPSFGAVVDDGIVDLRQRLPRFKSLLDVLRAMGADVEVRPQAHAGAEPVGTVTARSSDLTAVDLGEAQVPLLIDEIPIWALAAARAQGVSRLRGAAELRVKESDRLTAVSGLLRALGVEVREHPDGLDIHGRPAGWSGGENPRSSRCGSPPRASTP